MSEQLMTVNQVAVLYNVSPATVRRWIREERIDYVLVGPTRLRRIEKATVDRHLDRHVQEKTA